MSCLVYLLGPELGPGALRTLPPDKYDVVLLDAATVLPPAPREGSAVAVLLDPAATATPLVKVLARDRAFADLPDGGRAAPSRPFEDPRDAVVHVEPFEGPEAAAAAIECALALGGDHVPRFAFRPLGGDFALCGLNRAAWFLTEGKLDPLLGKPLSRAAAGVVPEAVARVRFCEPGRPAEFEAWHDMMSTGERKYLRIGMERTAAGLVLVRVEDRSAAKIREMQAAPAARGREDARAMLLTLESINSSLPFGLFRLALAGDRVRLEYASERACELLGCARVDARGGDGRGPRIEAFFAGFRGEVELAARGRARRSFHVKDGGGEGFLRIELYPASGPGGDGACDGLVERVPPGTRLSERRAGELVECVFRMAEEFREIADFYAPGGTGSDAPPAAEGALSPRETEVLSLLLRGRTNKEIAAALCISVSTVKKHVHRVLGKLDSATRRDLMGEARR